MGYPTTAVRPQRASMDRGSFQSPRTKTGEILRFPSAVSAAQKRRELQRQRKGKTAPRVKTRPPAANAMRAAGLRSARRGLTMYAQRVALRNQALHGLKFGIKFRAALFRSVAGFVLERLFDFGRTQLAQRNPSTAYHPLWSLQGRKGLYPWTAGGTSQHGIGSLVSHAGFPLQFNHAWAHPFLWCEYDSVQQLSMTITRFLCVGLGGQATGPTPAAFYAAIQNLPQSFEQEPNGLKNPWGAPYNPSWNRLPGRWPESFPDPENLPLPSGLDDFSWPVNAPQPVPMPMPYASLPHRQPNPYRAPNEQTQWGPARAPRPINRPIELDDPFAIGEPRVKPRDDPEPLEPWNPPIKRQPPDLVVRPRLRPRLRPRPRGKDRKPGRRVKEKKIKAVAVIAKLLLNVVNGISETSDFVRALHKALPKHRQKRMVKDQWAAVWRHWDEIDILDALRSVARDQVEDMIFGKLGMTSGKAANRRGGLYDPAGRANTRLQDILYDPDNPHPVKLILDWIFGNDT